MSYTVTLEFPELWELLNAAELRLLVLADHAQRTPSELPALSAAMGRAISGRDKLREALGIVTTFDPAEGSFDPPTTGRAPGGLVEAMGR